MYSIRLYYLQYWINILGNTVEERHFQIKDDNDIDLLEASTIESPPSNQSQKILRILFQTHFGSL